MGREQSRRYSINALEIVKKIQNKFKECPDISNLSEEDISCIKDQILMLSQNIKETNYRGFTFKDDLHNIRNKFAHDKETVEEQKLEKRLKTFFGMLPKIESELTQNIDRLYSSDKKVRSYEKFGSNEFGSEVDRKQTIDAISDQLESSLENSERIAFPENKYSAQANKILQPESAKEKKLLNYAKRKGGLKKSIISDIVDWLLKTRKNLFTRNPFRDEENFILNLQKNSAHLNPKIIEEMKEEYVILQSVNSRTRGNILPSNINFNFYKNKFINLSCEINQLKEELKSKKIDKEENILREKKRNQSDQIRKKINDLKKNKKSEDEIENEKVILLRNLKNDIEKSYIERKTAWELEEIEKERYDFMRELYEKIENFKKIEETLSIITGGLGRLWDLSNRPFEDSGFELLEQYAEILENDEFIKELSSLLGRQNKDQFQYEKMLRDEVTTIVEYDPKPAFRGEIYGLKLYNDIASVIPSELALYKNPKTKKYFMLKYAQKQLLSYSYEREMTHICDNIIQEEISDKQLNTDPKGPILICVDTSGSMHGIPERIAKTIAFALTKIAFSEDRSCYLISFSTKIETLDLSSLRGVEALTNLVQFLKMSFNGGTDPNPALYHTVKILKKKKWKNSDVLMISDFIMNYIPRDITDKITAEKNNGTGFYSLVIGKSSNSRILEIFDENWIYNPNDREAQKKLLDQLFLLKNRKNKIIEN